MSASVRVSELEGLQYYNPTVGIKPFNELTITLPSNDVKEGFSGIGGRCLDERVATLFNFSASRVNVILVDPFPDLFRVAFSSSGKDT